MPNQYTGLPPSKKFAASHVAARKIVERKLGRELARNEHVHHRDHDFTNNDEANLEVLSASEHMKYHQYLEQKALLPICRLIKQMYDSGLSQVKIAKLLGIAQQTVSLRLKLLPKYEEMFGE
jgi:HNH endonuclease